MSENRKNRVAEEIRKTISDMIFTGQIKNSKISTLTSITHVDLTGDFKHATVYISVMGAGYERAETIEGLNQSKGYIRSQLGRKIKIHHIPELKFMLDKSIENGIQMAKLIDQVIGENDNEN